MKNLALTLLIAVWAFACSNSNFSDNQASIQNQQSASGKASESANTLPDYSLFCSVDKDSAQDKVSNECYIADSNNRRANPARIEDSTWTHSLPKEFEDVSSVATEAANGANFTVVYSGAEKSRLLEALAATKIKVEFTDTLTGEKVQVESSDYSPEAANLNFKLIAQNLNPEPVDFSTWTSQSGSWKLSEEDTQITITSEGELNTYSSTEVYKDYYFRVMARNRNAPEKG